MKENREGKRRRRGGRKIYVASHVRIKKRVREGKGELDEGKSGGGIVRVQSWENGYI